MMLDSELHPDDHPTLRVLDMPVRTFNTGARYTERGQRITYCLVKHEGHAWTPITVDVWVLFRDRDRMVDGAIPVLFGNFDLIDDGWVRRAYGDYNFRQLTLTETQVLNNLTRGLK